MEKNKEMTVLIKFILLTVTLIPFSSAADCNGKAFRCFDPVHFVVCVDLGNGISNTIDSFVVPCPPGTECRDTNHFECEVPVTTTPATRTSDVTNTTLSIGIIPTLESYPSTIEPLISSSMQTIVNSNTLNKNVVTEQPFITSDVITEVSTPTPTKDENLIIVTPSENYGFEVSPITSEISSTAASVLRPKASVNNQVDVILPYQGGNSLGGEHKNGLLMSTELFDDITTTTENIAAGSTEIFPQDWLTTDQVLITEPVSTTTSNIFIDDTIIFATETIIISDGQQIAENTSPTLGATNIKFSEENNKNSTIVNLLNTGQTTENYFVEEPITVSSFVEVDNKTIDHAIIEIVDNNKTVNFGTTDPNQIEGPALPTNSFAHSEVIKSDEQFQTSTFDGQSTINAHENETGTDISLNSPTTESLIIETTLTLSETTDVYNENLPVTTNKTGVHTETIISQFDNTIGSAKNELQNITVQQINEGNSGQETGHEVIHTQNVSENLNILNKVTIENLNTENITLDFVKDSSNKNNYNNNVTTVTVDQNVASILNTESPSVVLEKSNQDILENKTIFFNVSSNIKDENKINNLLTSDNQYIITVLPVVDPAETNINTETQIVDLVKENNVNNQNITKKSDGLQEKINETENYNQMTTTEHNIPVKNTDLPTDLKETTIATAIQNIDLSNIEKHFSIDDYNDKKQNTAHPENQANSTTNIVIVNNDNGTIANVENFIKNDSAVANSFITHSVLTKNDTFHDNTTDIIKTQSGIESSITNKGESSISVDLGKLNDTTETNNVSIETPQILIAIEASSYPGITPDTDHPKVNEGAINTGNNLSHQNKLNQTLETSVHNANFANKNSFDNIVPVFNVESSVTIKDSTTLIDDLNKNKQTLENTKTFAMENDSYKPIQDPEKDITKATTKDATTNAVNESVPNIEKPLKEYNASPNQLNQFDSNTGNAAEIDSISKQDSQTIAMKANGNTGENKQSFVSSDFIVSESSAVSLLEVKTTIDKQNRKDININSEVNSTTNSELPSGSVQANIEQNQETVETSGILSQNNNTTANKLGTNNILNTTEVNVVHTQNINATKGSFNTANQETNGKTIDVIQTDHTVINNQHHTTNKENIAEPITGYQQTSTQSNAPGTSNGNQGTLASNTQVTHNVNLEVLKNQNSITSLNAPAHINTDISHNLHTTVKEMESKQLTTNNSLNTQSDTVKVKEIFVNHNTTTKESKNLFPNMATALSATSNQNVLKSGNKVIVQNPSQATQVKVTDSSFPSVHFGSAVTSSNKPTTQNTNNKQKDGNSHLNSTYAIVYTDNKIKTSLAHTNKDVDNPHVTEPAVDCKKLNRGRYSDQTDCRKFYICVGTYGPINGICPQNTVFSEFKKQCTKNLSHCIRENKFQCITSGRFIDHFRGDVYYICATNSLGQFVRFRLQCQSGYHLDQKTIKCTPNTVIIDSLSISSDDLSSKHKINKPARVSVNNNNQSSETSESEFECRKEGRFPIKGECKKYYECYKKHSKLRRRKRKCDSDEIFHKDKKKCVDAESYECEYSKK